jgi:hypothetical protein
MVVHTSIPRQGQLTHKVEFLRHVMSLVTCGHMTLVTVLAGTTLLRNSFGAGRLSEPVF